MKFTFAALALFTCSLTAHADSGGVTRSDEACRKMIEGFKDPASWKRETVGERFKEFRKVCFGKESPVIERKEISNKI